MESVLEMVLRRSLDPPRCWPLSFGDFRLERQRWALEPQARKASPSVLVLWRAGES